jgi:probable addiction module antidote protein
MPQVAENAEMDTEDDLKKVLRDNDLAIAAHLSRAFGENDLEKVLLALNQVMRAQNVQALAKEAGLRRDKLYTTFGGKVDPQLSRILKMFKALNVKFEVVPLGPRQAPPRPRLGRPKKP